MYKVGGAIYIFHHVQLHQVVCSSAVLLSLRESIVMMTIKFKSAGQQSTRSSVTLCQTAG